MSNHELIVDMEKIPVLVTNSNIIPQVLDSWQAFTLSQLTA